MSETFLVTGGCGFVGSNIAAYLRAQYSRSKVLALDNLRRRGSELNAERLRKHGVEFVHGDVREPSDLDLGNGMDFIIDCSAEPSVLAGVSSSPAYVVQTNLMGTANCLEAARKHRAGFVFLSTSRVYPRKMIDNLEYGEGETRFHLDEHQTTPGVSSLGISEHFPLSGPRTLYGATKLASELLILEYADMFGVRAVLNRCGTIAGPWQMGKLDQGFVALWVARHLWGGTLEYLGYGGTGKQVRDILHIDDLCHLVAAQIEAIESINGETFNVGGGVTNSVSLLELTAMCQKVVGRDVTVSRRAMTSPTDIRYYVTDTSKVTRALGWKPGKDVVSIVSDLAAWMNQYEHELGPVFLPETSRGDGPC